MNFKGSGHDRSFGLIVQTISNFGQMIMMLYKFYSKIFYSPDTCTELPAAVSHMRTTTTFPVIVGTVVEVQCQPGYTQAGGKTITCVKGISFTIGEYPTCTIGECFKALVGYRVNTIQVQLLEMHAYWK